MNQNPISLTNVNITYTLHLQCSDQVWVSLLTSGTHGCYSNLHTHRTDVSKPNWRVVIWRCHCCKWLWELQGESFVTNYKKQQRHICEIWRQLRTPLLRFTKVVWFCQILGKMRLMCFLAVQDVNVDLEMSNTTFEKPEMINTNLLFHFV